MSLTTSFYIIFSHFIHICHLLYSCHFKLFLVGFKALIETGVVRSIEIFMSRTQLIGVGLVFLLAHSLHFDFIESIAEIAS